ncbi:MAG: L,D-transpeptidase [Proteobacteria bacterium]|nr:L,D-transpeptidase [Pseudomonadota bacterium]
MRRVAAACAAIAVFCLVCVGFARAALASVVVHIDKSSQRMVVSVDGQVRHRWIVSTGRRPFGTPSGTYRPRMMARRWFSRKYDNSPMPYSIFYHKGYAIHGTNYIRQLGGPASHGCVRLHPANAAILFALVGRHGMSNTRIVVSH